MIARAYASMAIHLRGYAQECGYSGSLPNPDEVYAGAVQSLGVDSGRPNPLYSGFFAYFAGTHYNPGTFAISVSIGASVDVYLGIIHIGGSVDLNWGYSEAEGFSGSLTGTGAINDAVGVGLSVGPQLTITDADHVEDLLEDFDNHGGNAGPFGVTIVEGEGADRPVTGFQSVSQVPCQAWAPVIIGGRQTHRRSLGLNRGQRR